MRKPDLTVPELMFVVVTRALLAAGVGLLLAGRLSDKQRRMLGATLVAIGAVTTVPALMAVIGSRDRES
jgi:MFS family permease